MKLTKLKWLKLAGTIAIVAGILAFAIWGIIASRKKEKNYLNAFAGQVTTEIDSEFEAFDSLETKNPELFNFYKTQVSLREMENTNISRRINLIKNNFAVIGLNYNERKEVDSIVSNLTTYRASLTKIYSQLKEITDKDTITSSDAGTFKSVLKESYITNYDLIISEKSHLLNLLNNSLDRHNIDQPLYIENLSQISDLAVDITQKVHLPHIKDYGKNESSMGYTEFLFEKLNTALEKVGGSSKTYSDSSLATLVANMSNEIKSLKSQYEQFLSTYNNLTNEEKQILSQSGVGFNYEISTTNEHIISIINFLKEGGIYQNMIANNGDIMKGIKLG